MRLFQNKEDNEKKRSEVENERLEREALQKHSIFFGLYSGN
jgi:hypothetical protein